MRQAAIHINETSIVGEEILRTLSYFDIFYYPLTTEEIRRYLGSVPGDGVLSRALELQQKAGKVFSFNGFYSIQNNPLLAIRRKQGNHFAEGLISKAIRRGRFLFSFPFTRAIGISGSLSKNFADEKADIDFFIITKSNRLWIARTLMHLYKKLSFLRGRQHYYCMNYYIDESALQLSDQNIFTAIEIKTLLPVAGKQAMQQFFISNPWSNEWLPACSYREQEQKDPHPRFKKTLEWLMGGKFGNLLDNWFYHITTRRWKRKEEKGLRNEKGQAMGLITGKHFAKSNPGGFQEKVLATYQQKLTILK
jgi:hypothetical protein